MKQTDRTAALRAFTLIELLTVIMVVAILGAILIPIIGKVHSKSEAVICSNNLRQIGIAVQLYANENSGRLPGPLNGAHSSIVPAIDPWQLVAYLKTYLNTEMTGNSPSRNMTFICPSFHKQIEAPASRHYQVRVSPWIQMSNHRWAQPFGYPSYGDPADDKLPILLNLIKSPGEEWMLSDLDQVNNSAYRGNPLAPVTPVHGDVRNTLFFDGHIEAVPVKNSMVN